MTPWCIASLPQLVQFQGCPISFKWNGNSRDSWTYNWSFVFHFQCKSPGIFIGKLLPRSFRNAWSSVGKKRGFRSEALLGGISPLKLTPPPPKKMLGPLAHQLPPPPPITLNSSKKTQNHPEWTSQQTRYIDPMLVHCWASVVDGGPTLDQHWLDVSCFLGYGWPISHMSPWH